MGEAGGIALMGEKPVAAEGEIAKVSAKGAVAGGTKTHKVATQALKDGAAGAGGVVVAPVGITKDEVDVVSAGCGHQTEPMFPGGDAVCRQNYAPRRAGGSHTQSHGQLAAVNVF